MNVENGTAEDGFGTDGLTEVHGQEPPVLPSCFTQDPMSLLRAAVDDADDDEATPFSVVTASHLPAQAHDSVRKLSEPSAVESDASRPVVRLLASSLKMPWDSNPVLNPKRALSFGQPSLEQMKIGMRDFISDASVGSAVQVMAQPAELKHTLKRARLANCAVDSDDLRFKSISLIKLMLTCDMTLTCFGIQLQQQDCSAAMVNSSIQDALSTKATGTLYKRARSMWNLFTWVRAYKLGRGLDFTEQLVYEYLCMMRDAKRGATSGEAVLQAIRFFHSLFGLQCFDPSVMTARVKGVAHSMYLQKRCLQQARALYVEELRALERVVLFDLNPHIQIIAGYLLFCVMAVCRFSDGMFVRGFKLSSYKSVCLLEAGTTVHKTAHTRERKTTLLPLVALGHVFEHGQSWAELWMQLRSDHLDLSKPYVLPAYSETTSKWLSRPMTTGEGIMWLRDVIGLYCKTGEVLTTHSLKATFLSWSTLLGTLDFDQRRILGHHVDAGTASPLTYGRDNVVQLQIILAKMLQKIGSGAWDLDLPRAQRVYEELRATMTDLDEDDALSRYPRDPNHPDDSSDVEPAVDIEDAIDDAGLDPKVYMSASKADGRILQHSSSGVLHFIALDDRFMCGRKINAFYEAVTFDLSHEWPICQQCRHVLGEEALATFIE